MGMLNLLAFIGALVIAVAGGGVVYWADHHKPIPVYMLPGPVRWLLPAPLKTIAIPDSLETRAERALAETANWKISYGQLVKAANAQEKAVQGLRAQSAISLAAGRSVSAQAQRAAVVAASKREVIHQVAQATTGTVCERAQAVDKAFLEALK